MNIVQCQACGAQYDGSALAPGQSFQCARCGNAVVMGAPQSLPPPPQGPQQQPNYGQQGVAPRSVPRPGFQRRMGPLGQSRPDQGGYGPKQGQYPYNAPPGYAPQRPSRNPYGHATASQQGNIPGTVIAGFVLSFLCPILGIIFCCVGMGEAKRRNAGHGLAIAGLIISIANMVLGGIIASLS